MVISAPNSFQSRLLAARLHGYQNGPWACLCRQVNFTTKPVSGEICSFDKKHVYGVFPSPITKCTSPYSVTPEIQYAFSIHL